MADTDTAPPPGAAPALPTLEDLQHWTSVMGRAQQLMMEFVSRQMLESQAAGIAAPPAAAFNLPAMSWPTAPIYADPAKIAQAQVDMWTQGLDIWQRALSGQPQQGALQQQADQDKRFNAPQWRDNPLFDMIRQSYLLIADRMLGSVDAIEGVDDKQR